ncbi:alpha/beta hydrolase (plasmid) [Embleya sp. NBC_00888]|uniref:alpha/beta hydrolase n=1 Tax=Embleya sp. NBC_00888 TaxID=2975960 RepID=UPI002F90E8BA|nr:alpha/beta hydrolase [Embleya sp. NBC_00888]
MTSRVGCISWEWDNVPYGYLFTVVVAAVVTALALAPLRRPRPLAELSFRLGLVVNELPFVAIVWLIGWTGVAYAQGDLDSTAARVTAGVAALTLPGLVVIARRGLRARRVLDDALTEALGADRRTHLATASSLRTTRTLLTPFRRRRRGVERIANIAYGDAGRRNLLDVYRRRSGPVSGAPVLVHLHGGGYRRGRKNTQSLPLIHRFANRGWVCVSANYRLRPAAQHPDHLIDLKKVIAWVRAHAHEYGADPDTLVVSGSSAGGQMAALAALTPGDPAYQPGFADADTSVTAVISLNGYHGGYFDRDDESSPVFHVRPDAPPFLIVHGDADTMVPVENARAFTNALRSVSRNPVVYAELPGAQHAFDLFRSVRFEAVVDATEEFVAWVREQPAAPGGIRRNVAAEN